MKFSLFSFSVHKVEDCQLTTAQMIDLLLPTGCSFQEREFDKHNLGQLIYHSKYGRKSLDSEYKYCLLGPIWFSLEEDNEKGQTLNFFFLVPFVVEVKMKIKEKKKKSENYIFFS